MPYVTSAALVPELSDTPREAKLPFGETLSNGLLAVPGHAGAFLRAIALPTAMLAAFLAPILYFNPALVTSSVVTLMSSALSGLLPGWEIAALMVSQCMVFIFALCLFMQSWTRHLARDVQHDRGEAAPILPFWGRSLLAIAAYAFIGVGSTALIYLPDLLISQTDNTILAAVVSLAAGGLSLAGFVIYARLATGIAAAALGEGAGLGRIWLITRGNTLRLFFGSLLTAIVLHLVVAMAPAIAGLVAYVAPIQDKTVAHMKEEKETFGEIFAQIPEAEDGKITAHVEAIQALQSVYAKAHNESVAEVIDDRAASFIWTGFVVINFLLACMVASFPIFAYLRLREMRQEA